MATDPNAASSGVSAEAVRGQLNRILASKTFRNSERLNRFLSYVVEQALHNATGNLKEYAIGVAVFERPESYDTGSDPIVRVEARRLRSKLQEYSEREGQIDKILIELPKPGYTPLFREIKAIKLRPIALSSSAPTVSETAPQRHRILWLPVLAAILGLVGIGLWLAPPKESKGELVLTRLTWDSGLTTNPELSRDGRLLTYASDRSGEGNLDIWVRQVAGGEPLRLTSHPADDRQPAFSPDGTLVAFRSERDGGGVYLISALGGREKRIADRGRSPRFSADGKWIAYWTGSASSRGLAFPGEGQIFIVPADGGTPRPIVPEFASASYPVWLPDGNHLLFLGYPASQVKARVDFDWWVAPLDGTPAVHTGAAEILKQSGLAFLPLEGSPGGWTPQQDDQILFSAALGDSHNLWSVRLSSNDWRIDGSPRRITSGPGREGQPAAAGKRIAFANIQWTADIWELPVHAAATPQLRSLTRDAAPNFHPSISHDGHKVAFTSLRTKKRSVWIKETATGRETGISAPGAEADFPVISSDGSKIVYRTSQEKTSSIHLISTTGGAVEKSCPGCGIPTSLSPDARRVLYSVSGSSSVFVWDVVMGEKSEWLRHPTYGLFRAQFSPNGRWVAVSARTGLCCRQVLVAPFRNPPPPPEEWISLGEPSGWDDLPRWSPDGSILYFVSDRDGFRCLWAQRLNPASAHLAGSAFPVYHFHSASRSPLNLVARDEFDFSVAQDRVVLSLAEITGNLWMGTLQ
jgi:Tol biopolymer transport system component